MDNINRLFQLNGKIAVVTGASEGIGLAIAEAFAKLGVLVILCGRNKAKLNNIKNKIVATSGKAETFQLDISDYYSIQQLHDFITNNFGSLDILVNSAGYAVTKKSIDITEKDFDEMCNVGYRGLFFCCQQLYKIMKNTHYGKIINLSSTFSKSTDINRTVYASIKAAVSHLTEALAVEWAEDGIRVNALAPTAVMTPSRREVLDEKKLKELTNKIPLGRIAITDDLIGTAIFLASEASDFITGQTIFVDGGFTLK